MLWLLSILLFSSAGIAAGPPTPDYRTTVNEVQLEVVATDASGRPVQDLDTSDIRVREDGQQIENFGLSQMEGLPLFATVIYDTSESNEKAWRLMQGPVTKFLRETISEGDQLWIGAFDSNLRFKTRVEGVAQFRPALNAAPGRDNLTGFNDALFKALLDEPEAVAEPRRRAMIVFSDGEDNYSIHSLPEVIAAAQKAKVAVYSIRRVTKKSARSGGAALHALAVGTGGRDFAFTNLRQFEDVLTTISGELRSCYVLYYTPPRSETGSEFRTVSVAPANGKRIRIHVQNRYYVTGASSAAGD
jgi:VWFA-related protein